MLRKLCNAKFYSNYSSSYTTTNRPTSSTASANGYPCFRYFGFDSCAGRCHKTFISKLEKEPPKALALLLCT
jgi:hypothetical protein